MTAPRYGAWAAYLSFAGFLSMSIDSILHAGPQRYRDVVILVPVLGILGALTALHRLQAGRVRFERPLYLLNAFAIGTMIICQVTQMLVDPGAAATLFMIPALGWIAGNIAYGVVTIRARVLPPVAGLLLIVAQPATMALGVLLEPVAGLYDYGSYSGAIGNAVAFGAIGVALATLRSRGDA